MIRPGRISIKGLYKIVTGANKFLFIKSLFGVDFQSNINQRQIEKEKTGIRRNQGWIASLGIYFYLPFILL
jgi:hypothetical protein